MVVRIVISGESQCIRFAEACLIADFLSQNLPAFKYERIEKPAAEWPDWLSKLNKMYKWHHKASPIIWKEVLVRGSKPFLIGGSSEFLDYCFSYYNFDSFLATEKYEKLVEHLNRLKKKVISNVLIPVQQNDENEECKVTYDKTFYRICISGAGNPMTMYLISGLLEMVSDSKCIVTIYIFDETCDPEFMLSVEKECNFIPTEIPCRVVRYVEKVGFALTQADLLIVLDHVPFRETMAIGEWLDANRRKMKELSMMINSSALTNLNIVFPNLGPSCFNATCLMNLINNYQNIVVATSDLGIEILPHVSEIAKVPTQNMFCPPVWGFVGINHLVDVNTAVHRYNSFEPNKRFIKVKNSSLKIGNLRPELREMQYLMYRDTMLWQNVAQYKTSTQVKPSKLKEITAVLNLVNLWIFDPQPDYIVSLGTKCDGSFGLTFDGIFSQPAHLVNGKWIPANTHMLPKDPYMSITYLQDIAKRTMELTPIELPQIVPYYPCWCKRNRNKTKGDWCIQFR